MNDGDLAAALAKTAGQILCNVRDSNIINGKSLGKAGDETANQFLCHALRQARPNDGLLSEESQDTAERLSKERVWIIDPVDGTREFSEGRADWAVHVGLSIDGNAVLGAVALPSLDMVLRSDQPLAFPRRSDKLRMLVSRTRPAKEALIAAQQMDAELIEMGSAGAKAMAIVRGEADIYLHSGGQYEWDNCAPVVVAEAHGLHCSRIDGSPLRYNQKNVYLPDILICHKEDAEKVLEIISDYY